MPILGQERGQRGLALGWLGLASAWRSQFLSLGLVLRTRSALRARRSPLLRSLRLVYIPPPAASPFPFLFWSSAKPPAAAPRLLRAPSAAGTGAGDAPARGRRWCRGQRYRVAY